MRVIAVGLGAGLAGDAVGVIEAAVFDHLTTDADTEGAAVAVRTDIAIVAVAAVHPVQANAAAVLGVAIVVGTGAAVIAIDDAGSDAGAQAVAGVRLAAGVGVIACAPLRNSLVAT